MFAISELIFIDKNRKNSISAEQPLNCLLNFEGCAIIPLVPIHDMASTEQYNNQMEIGKQQREKGNLKRNILNIGSKW